ncbi:aminoglycoside 6-adenylyltransferase [Cytobacillus kochii]|uniref:aminoglycoside 6-adenylyltransferase n=1 Tax=Cytobacillus kochii TaxID=859143 RepID=UPI0038505BB4
MRSETEMMATIIDFAKNEERIFAVYMNGSRTNINVPRDQFQDYDIVYVVEDTEPFIKNQNWIASFGELIMKQEPDKNDFGKEIVQDFKSYGFLMLFTDGNRIDLRFQTKEVMRKEYGEDKLTVPLLDKGEYLPIIPPPTDVDYHVQTPSEGEYDAYTNNFWWCLQNVAKGIWRDEWPYAQAMFNSDIRDALNKMVDWWIGIQYDFRISTGKLGKYYKCYLPPSYWEMYRKTYSDGDEENMWEAVMTTCKLFRALAQEVANHLRFSYPINDDRRMLAYLEGVRQLPKA